MHDHDISGINTLRKKSYSMYSAKTYRIVIFGEVVKSRFPENLLKNYNISIWSNTNYSINEWKMFPVWKHLILPLKSPTSLKDMAYEERI